MTYQIMRSYGTYIVRPTLLETAEANLPTANATYANAVLVDQ